MVGWWGLLVGVLELSSHRHYDVMGLERLVLGELRMVSRVEGRDRLGMIDLLSLICKQLLKVTRKQVGIKVGVRDVDGLLFCSSLKGIPKVFIDRCKLCESGAQWLSPFFGFDMLYYQP